MARKDCLPSARAGKHASGDPIRFFGGDARRGRWRGARSWIRKRLLVGGQTSGSHGREWPASAVSSRVVTRHHFLFPRSVLFLQNADVEMKSPNGQRLGTICTPTTSSITSDRFESISFATYPSFSLPAFLQLLLELPPNAQWARGTEKH